jgi:MFS superfamily sulfate permease-like transporter
MKGYAMIPQLLTRKVASDSLVIRIVQAGCFVAAVLIPFLAFRRFAELELSGAPLLVGVLGSMAMALFFTVLGVLLHLNVKAA